MHSPDLLLFTLKIWSVIRSVIWSFQSSCFFFFFSGCKEKFSDLAKVFGCQHSWPDWSFCHFLVWHTKSLPRDHKAKKFFKKLQWPRYAPLCGESVAKRWRGKVKTCFEKYWENTHHLGSLFPNKIHCICFDLWLFVCFSPWPIWGQIHSRATAIFDEQWKLC